MKKPYIKLSSVNKDFNLQGERTFKEFIPSLLMGNKWAKKLRALNNLSFEINKGETVGIVGHNGAGKSTLMKLIAGVSYPTEGKLTVNGTVAPLIELGAGFQYDLNGYENIYLNGAILGMQKKEIDAVLQDIIEFSGIKDFLHEPLKRFSTGMVMRLAFAIAVHTKADIYLIDEVLAVGDMEFQRKCLQRLTEIKENKDKIIIYISHDEKSVKEFCDRAILLEHGKLVTDGKPSKVFESYK